jgi:predicted amidohydrolase
MIIATAQTATYLSGISNNIENHITLTKLAAKNGAHLILFPEMSLTSYERLKSRELSFSNQDGRLSKLKMISIE